MGIKYKEKDLIRIKSITRWNGRKINQDNIVGEMITVDEGDSNLPYRINFGIGYG